MTYISHLASLRELNVLVAQILRLQEQIMSCETKLVKLSLSEQGSSRQEQAKALKDEIFGCRIEIQSLRRHIKRLKVKTSTL